MLKYIYQLAKFGDLMSSGSRDMKNAPCPHVIVILIMMSQIWYRSWDG